jgi:hypothetical protein
VSRTLPGKEPGVVTVASETRLRADLRKETRQSRITGSRLAALFVIVLGTQHRLATKLRVSVTFYSIFSIRGEDGFFGGGPPPPQKPPPPSLLR